VLRDGVLVRVERPLFLLPGVEEVGWVAVDEFAACPRVASEPVMGIAVDEGERRQVSADLTIKARTVHRGWWIGLHPPGDDLSIDIDADVGPSRAFEAQDRIMAQVGCDVGVMRRDVVDQPLVEAGFAVWVGVIHHRLRWSCGRGSSRFPSAGNCRQSSVHVAQDR
jgi:hypothetical protein